MELHQRNPILRPYDTFEAMRKRLRDESLPRSWRPLEDDLPLVIKESFDFREEIGG